MKVPQKIKGAWIWSHVLPQLVPEIAFDKLLKLGTIVKHKDKIRFIILFVQAFERYNGQKFLV